MTTEIRVGGQYVIPSMNTLAVDVTVDDAGATYDGLVGLTP